MTKKARAILACFTLSTIVFFSCSKDKEENNNCIQYETSPVTNVAGPKTAAPNEVIDLVLTYGIASGCGQYDHIEEVHHGTTTNVNVVGKYTGCTCTLIYREEQLTYNFKQATPGTYYLEFYQDPNTTVKDTIVVQ